MSNDRPGKPPLIHHIGARSGTERVTPVGCFNVGDGRFAVVASNGGSPTHPAWHYNLKANPRTQAEAGTESFTVLAEELEGTARAELWPALNLAIVFLAHSEDNPVLREVGRRTLSTVLEDQHGPAR